MNADAGNLALTARNATIEDLVALLRGQQARKVDVVAPPRRSGPRTGTWYWTGPSRPADVCDAGIADKLGIPAGYLKRMRASRPGLFDANVNGWLAGDDRSFFVRCLRGGDGQTGIARAWLSDGYKTIDHIDTLMAVFDGIRASGQQVSIDSCDLTGRRTYVRVRCEAVQVLAPALPAGYRSPFTGAAGADSPSCSPGSCWPTPRPAAARARSRPG
jgi:hypothetical protein